MKGKRDNRLMNDYQWNFSSVKCRKLMVLRARIHSQDSYGGCQVNGPKVAKFLDR